MTSKSVNNHPYQYFDWELYLATYRHIIEDKFNTKDKVWWHFVHIGESKGFSYFNIYHREMHKSNFNWIQYKNKNPYLFFQGYKTKEQLWSHFIKAEPEPNNKRILPQNSKQNILYYVGVTSTQNFNTGIQRVTRNLSKFMGNKTDEYDIFLIKFDPSINDFTLINQEELSTFSKYNGYNHLKNTNFEEKTNLFQIIKTNPENIFFLSELFYTHHFDLLHTVIEKANSYGFKTFTVYHDDSIYNDVGQDKNIRENNFNNYMRALAKFNVIIPNSKYSEYTYLFHKERLNLKTKQLVENVPLAGEIIHSRRLIEPVKKDKYIFANISVCERKNARTLIKSFNMLSKLHPNLKLIICGEVYAENSYYKTFKELLNDNIIFVSRQSDEKLAELYQKCLFTVYPSIEEGFGLPIYESLWNNSPVICHTATSTLEIALEVNHDAVQSVNCLDEQILFLAMKKMLDKDFLKRVTKDIHTIKIKTWREYSNEIIQIIRNVKEKNIIYYYIDHTSTNPARTGIQILSIYLARQLIKKVNKHNVKLVFVKWDNIYNELIPSASSEINHFFNYNEKENLVKINYTNQYEIINPNNFKKCIFLCPEVPKIFHESLSKYLVTNNLRSIYILHDIIPLVLKDDVYKNAQESFYKYLQHNILQSSKIITNSDFTKTEFLKYCENNNVTNIPPVTNILLPYQYRNKKRVTNKQSNANSKISILLPGSFEPRKQQLLFMEIFNKFIQNNPHIDIELIAFGHSNYSSDVINEQVALSRGKIKFLGIITNEILFELYKKATFTCFISKYEGYGFPIAESLWHGTPVLTSCFSSMYEIAASGGCYCVDSNNHNMIYSGLEMLVKKPKLLIKLREDLEKSNLSTWEDYAEKILKEILD